MRAALCVFALLPGIPAVCASLIHDYQFQNTLADSLGGPSLVSLGGTIGAGEYSFAAEQGLSLSNALPDDTNYSIYLDFEFDTLSGYRKIVDFKNLASDNGLYNLNTDLNFYNFNFGPSGALTAGTFAQVVLTRDSSTNTVTGYVNGVQQIQFVDSTSDGVFSAANNIINFFQDDAATGGRESSSGEVSEIQIYDAPLTAQQVAGLSTSTPEPVSSALVGIGLAIAVAQKKRRPI
jgi:hypothetical protein